MPYEKCERNMRLFADKVMPVLKNDNAFKTDDSEARA